MKKARNQQVGASTRASSSYTTLTEGDTALAVMEEDDDCQQRYGRTASLWNAIRNTGHSEESMTSR